jgi:tripartite ATP-independent transporter DctM subunit
MTNFVLISVPLYIFMASILETSGVADDLFTMMHKWFAPVPGGLAMGTIVICTIFAAMSGVSAAATVTMGLIALPAMMKRGYDKNIATGCISAGGGLGQIIPPSVMMIVWSLWAGESVGQMYMGGFLPGLTLSAMFIAYIGIRCFFKKEIGPPIPREERPTWGEKISSIKAVILPVLIILGVLGSMFAGIATPTEAAAIGSVLAILSAGINRKLSWKIITNSLQSTARVTGMIMWIIFAGASFAGVFTAIGGQDFVTSTIKGLEVNPWLVIIVMQIIYLILGCMLDPNAIMMLSIPIFVPIVRALGFDSLWFGVLSIINIELGFITPPFGLNLFYMRGIVPKDISMADIYRSVLPFIIVQLIALVLFMVFPKIITVLPNMMFGR